MSIIGSFTKNESGFSGAITTLYLEVKAKSFPVPNDNDKAPDFQTLVSSIEFGAGWKNQPRTVMTTSASAWMNRALAIRFLPISSGQRTQGPF